MTSEGRLWVVDWDLPAEPPGIRRSFYRAVRRYLQENRGLADYSTQSVLITGDEAFARFVFAEASKRGRCNLYRAEAVQSSGQSHV